MAADRGLILGMHSYSLHTFGYCGAWAGNEPEPPVWDIFGLMDKAVDLGLAGLHVTAVDLGGDDAEHLARVGKAARERNLYLEFNFSLDAAAYDPRMERTIDQGIDIAAGLGSDIAKITTDVQRPRPLFGGRFHPDIMPRLEELARKLIASAPRAEAVGVKLAVENHQDLFAEELLWVLDRVDHTCVKACLDPTNAIPLGEDINRVVDLLAPVAVTNHITDYGYRPLAGGMQFTGTVIGRGDMDIEHMLRTIHENSPTRRINLEVELNVDTGDVERARKQEWSAVVESVAALKEMIVNITEQ